MSTHFVSIGTPSASPPAGDEPNSAPSAPRKKSSWKPKDVAKKVGKIPTFWKTLIAVLAALVVVGYGISVSRRAKRLIGTRAGRRDARKRRASHRSNRTRKRV